MLFVAGILIFKNQIFYVEDELMQYVTNESCISGYEEKGAIFQPIINDPAIAPEVILKCKPDAKTDEIRLIFDQNLAETSNFIFYNCSSNVEQYVMGNVISEAGEKSVEFRFDPIYIDKLIIHIKTPDSTQFINIPHGRIFFNSHYFSFLPQDTKCVVRLCIILGVSFVISIIFCIIDFHYINEKKVTKVRESNVELLRVICMFLIILHHYVAHSVTISMEYCPNKVIAYFVGGGGKICFNAFIVISAWFLVDKKFSLQRFIKVWLQVLFYSVTFTIITMLISDTFTVKNLFSCILPIAGNSHGFAANYLLFYLLFPFIQKMLNSLKQRDVVIVLSLVFYAQVVSKVVGIVNGYTQNFSSEIGHFIFCYILTYYLKKWPPKWISNNRFHLAVWTGIWLLAFQANCMMYLWGNGNQLTKWIGNLAQDETSILFIIAGFALFFFMNNIKIQPCYIINKLASFTFGILLFHDHNFFRPIFWNNIVIPKTWYYANFYIIRVLIMGICIFYVGCVIDFIRQKMLEIPIMNSSFIKNVVEKIERKLLQNDKMA